MGKNKASTTKITIKRGERPKKSAGTKEAKNLAGNVPELETHTARFQGSSRRSEKLCRQVDVGRARASGGGLDQDLHFAGMENLRK